ncbi:MAG: endonuclease III [Candidatus Latescibacterota bacterium]|nr:endonuclease III [Candidatus Latescibacterota bacterium]
MSPWLSESKALEVATRLSQDHPEARVELDHRNPLELLIATILAAQCTDERVNRVTKHLFAKYSNPQAYLDVEDAELEEDIKETGFFRQKARSLKGAMQMLVDDFDGGVPRTMDELTQMPGVGRKTANVILGIYFGVPGIVVDTHVSRVSRLLGLTTENNAVKIEGALGEVLPEEEWIGFGHRLILHGRYVCKAKHPDCGRCRLMDLCEFYQKQ